MTEEKKKQPERTAEREGFLPDPDRRGVLKWMAAGWTVFTAASLGGIGVMVRFLFPNVLYEPAQVFKAGSPDDFIVGAVDQRFKDKYATWIVREPRGFYALSTTCTHLGCTPNWLQGDQKFKCPCHGSGFMITGINFEGPAPRPLERWKIGLAEDGQLLVDKTVKFQQEKGEWAKPDSYLEYMA